MDGGGGENQRGNEKHPFKLRAFCTVPKIGSILATSHIFNLFALNYHFSIQRKESLPYITPVTQI